MTKNSELIAETVNHCLSRKWYEIGPWLLWNVIRKS